MAALPPADPAAPAVPPTLAPTDPAAAAASAATDAKNADPNQQTQALALSLLALSSVPLLPAGWNIARDQSTGKFYFYNTSTGAVQWEPPVVPGAAGAGEMDPAAAAAAASALMAGGKRALEDSAPQSAAGVLLGGAGGVGGTQQPEKRARLGEGRQSDFEEEAVQKLKAVCGEPSQWNTKKRVIEFFKASPMWAAWTKAGHNEQKLVYFINRLKIKHLEDGHNQAAAHFGISLTAFKNVCRKDTGANSAEFEPEVVEKLNLWCGETSRWNTKKKIIDSFKDLSPFWSRWTAVGNSEQKLVNLINRLKIRHTEEAAKGSAAAAAALAAANGTVPPPGVITSVGGRAWLSVFESEVVAQLNNLCGEPSLWNTKKEIIDQFKTTDVWSSWVAAGHNEQKLVNFVNRLKIKHLGVEGGGSSGGGGGVSAFEPEVVKQLSQVCGQVRNAPKKSLPSLCIVSVQCLSLSLSWPARDEK